METQRYLEEDWSYFLSFLPARAELERSAAQWGAIRRFREISSASTLLRLMMAYGFCGMSLRRTAAWATEIGLANLSDVSLLDRLRNGANWLGHVLALKLADHATFPTEPPPRLRARLIDASTVTRVGGRGIDWRLHLTIDLASLKVDDIELTDSSGGERLSRFKFHPNDLVVGDAGYAHRKGLDSVARQGAHFLIRLNWSNLPLLTLDDEPLDLLARCRSVAGAEPTEVIVRVRDSAIDPVRLLIVRKTAAAAAESRRRKERERSKKGSVDPRTLEASEYVMLLTSAPSEQLTTEQAFELYRFRWQIEMTFKRLKSLLDFDQMPAKNAALAQVILRSKLLGALLVDDYTERYLSFSPWGYLIRADSSPLSVANH